ncbi:chitin deacetylase [Chytriomyces hyalinus]|nr:chitin deacetylase [Chytriomyces hyalinus]
MPSQRYTFISQSSMAVALLIGVLSVTAAALNPALYPAQFTRGPAPLDQWVVQYLTNANIPNVPVNKVPNPFPDWTLDETACEKSNAWAITFDDGPGDFTPILLDLLDKAHVKITFFVVGSRLLSADQANVLLRAYQAGHQIGIHTWSHMPLTTQTNEQILGEILWSGSAIQEITGVFPQYFRPPYGDIDPRVRAIIHSVGLKTIVWNEDSKDWLQADPSSAKAYNFSYNDLPNEFASWIQNPPEPDGGIISLQHDLFGGVDKVVNQCLQMVMSAGYNILPVGNCISNPVPWYWKDNTSAAWSVGNALNNGGAIAPPEARALNLSQTNASKAEANTSAISSQATQSKFVETASAAPTTLASVGSLTVSKVGAAVSFQQPGMKEAFHSMRDASSASSNTCIFEKASNMVLFTLMNLLL